MAFIFRQRGDRHIWTADGQQTSVDRRQLPQKIALACVSSRIWPAFGLVILRAQALPAYGLATLGALDKRFWLVGN